MRSCSSLTRLPHVTCAAGVMERREHCKSTCAASQGGNATRGSPRPAGLTATVSLATQLRACRQAPTSSTASSCMIVKSIINSLATKTLFWKVGKNANRKRKEFGRRGRPLATLMEQGLLPQQDARMAQVSGGRRSREMQKLSRFKLSCERPTFAGLAWHQDHSVVERHANRHEVRGLGFSAAPFGCASVTAAAALTARRRAGRWWRRAPPSTPWACSPDGTTWGRCAWRPPRCSRARCGASSRRPSSTPASSTSPSTCWPLCLWAPPWSAP